MTTSRRALLLSAATATVGGVALVGANAEPASAATSAATDAAAAAAQAGTVVALGNVPVGTATVHLDVSAGDVFTCTLTGDTSFDFVSGSWPTGAAVAAPTVIATQDAHGGHTIDFSSANVTWLPEGEGSQPAFDLGPGQTSVIPFFSPDNGTTVYGQSATAPTDQDASGLYGDGSDGVVVLDGSAPGAGNRTQPALSTDGLLGGAGSGRYFWLKRDTYLSSLTLLNNATLQLAGGSSGTYRLFCSGTVTVNAGSSIVTYVNTPAAGATGGSNLATGSLAPGQNGPNGGTGAGAKGTDTLGQTGGTAGAGGAGGASGGTPGGAPGVSTPPAGGLPKALPWAALMAVGPNASGALTRIPGGASGGAGAGDGSNKGGGGGAGGNPLFLAARSIVNNGQISAYGGNGGDGTGGTAGGGGGGQGGPVTLIYGALVGNTPSSLPGKGGNPPGSPTPPNPGIGATPPSTPYPPGSTGPTGTSYITKLAN